MKKLFLSIACAWLVSSPALADIYPAQSVFSGDTFTVARAVKLGRGETSVYDSGNISDDTPGTGMLEGQCNANTDCAGDQKCQGGECVSVCTPPQAKPGMTLGRICAGQTCIPSVKIGGEAHTFSCIECETDAQCSNGKMCLNNKCSDPCSSLTCGEGLICDSSTGAAKCVECMTDNQCGSGKYCNTARNVCLDEDPCAGVVCGNGKYCKAGQCLFRPLGSTEDCTAGKVADGKGGCKYPCDGVTCPVGKSCTNGTDGTACCGDTCLKPVARLVRVNGLLQSKQIETYFHPQLKACFPVTIKPYPYKRSDFVFLKEIDTEPKFKLYTDLAEAVEESTALTTKDISTFVVSTGVQPATLKTSNTTAIKQLTVNPVLLQAATANDDTLTIKVNATTTPVLKTIAQ